MADLYRRESENGKPEQRRERADERGQVAWQHEPSLPYVTPSGDGHASRIPGWDAAAALTSEPFTRPWSGDGHGRTRHHVSVPDTLTILPGHTGDGHGRVRPTKPAKGKTAVKKQEKSETWKLMMLVVLFLLWVSTASTLLFLYMDRYLFP